MNNFFRTFIILILLNFACEKKSKKIEFSHHQQYLKNEINLKVSDLQSGRPIYLIDLSSCSGCIELNFNYLKNNCSLLNLQLLIVGNHKGTIWQNEIEDLQKCYQTYFDEKSKIRRYNISSSKPILLSFDEDGKIIRTNHIQDFEIDLLPKYIEMNHF